MRNPWHKVELDPVSPISTHESGFWRCCLDGMDIRRTLLSLVFGLSLLMLWQVQEGGGFMSGPPIITPAERTPAPRATRTPTEPPASSAQPPASEAVAPEAAPPPAPKANDERIRIRTDLMQADFDPRGGTLMRLELLAEKPAPDWTAEVSAPSGVTAVLVSPFVGRFIGRCDARWLASASFAIFAVSYFMRAQFTADSSFWVFVMPMLVQGVAMRMFFVSMLAISLDRLPPERVPAASGLNNFLRITAGSFATSLTTTYWDRREAFHQSRLVESLTAYDPPFTHILGRLHAQGLTDPSAATAVMHQVIGQSYLLSSLDIFYFSGWLTLLLLPLCWIVRKPQAGAAVTAAE
jgi:hypothetical protein